MQIFFMHVDINDTILCICKFYYAYVNFIMLEKNYLSTDRVFLIGRLVWWANCKRFQCKIWLNYKALIS